MTSFVVSLLQITKHLQIQALADQAISKVSDCLIMEVQHFLVFNQALTKDVSKISCIPTQTATLDKHVVHHKKFDLIARINHLQGCHVWQDCLEIQQYLEKFEF